MVVGRGLALTGAGLAIGLALAAAGTRAMKTMLYGVDAIDPATFAGVAALLCAHRRAGLLGPGPPRRRASTRSWCCGKSRRIRNIPRPTRNSPFAGAVGPDFAGNTPTSAIFPRPASISVPTIFRTMCFRNPLPRTR